MALTIWKFALDARSDVVRMPSGAKLLTAQMQGHDPVVWAIVNPQNPIVSRRLKQVGTGQNLGLEVLGEYVGTYTLHGGTVVHVFDMGQVDA